MTYIFNNSRRTTRQKAITIDNAELYYYFEERLINLALSQFDWSGLPETVDRYYLEKILLTRGSVCFFKPKDIDSWMALDYIEEGGKWDAYGYPIGVKPVDWNGHYHVADPKHTHIMYDNNNLTRAPLMLGIELHARRLYEVENTFRNNVIQQNTPYIVAAQDKGDSNSLKEIMRQIFNFSPVIGVKGGSMSAPISNKIDVLRTDVPFIGRDLFETRQSVWKDALSMLGIASETTKRERMLDDELTLNRQEDMISLQSRLLNRMNFCNKMNKKYGLNMSVNTSDISVRTEQLIDEDDRELRNIKMGTNEQKKEDTNNE